MRHYILDKHVESVVLAVTPREQVLEINSLAHCDNTLADARTLFPPSRGQLSDWLQKKDCHPILELSYLEVGLGSQSIHMEFGDGAAAYTLLVRNSIRCKRFFGLLTGKRKHWQTKWKRACV